MFLFRTNVVGKRSSQRPYLGAVCSKNFRACRACAQFGGGGGIPFLNMLGERFPRAQSLVTGVLGPGANAHAPNEFLHLPTAKRLTAVLAEVLAATTGVRR